MLVQYVDSNKVCINASNCSFFFLHNTCRPTKSSINHDYGGRKSNSIVEPTKKYLCTVYIVHCKCLQDIYGVPIFPAISVIRAVGITEKPYGNQLTPMGPNGPQWTPGDPIGPPTDLPQQTSQISPNLPSNAPMDPQQSPNRPQHAML